MSEERKLILKMLQENRISIDEADQLLGALENKTGPKASSSSSSSQDNIFNKTAPKMEQLMGTISSMIDSVSTQLGPGLEKRFEGWFQQRGPNPSSEKSDDFHEQQSQEERFEVAENIQQLSCFNRLGDLSAEAYDGQEVVATMTKHIHTSSIEEKLKYEELKLVAKTDEETLRITLEGAESLKALHHASVSLHLKVPKTLDLNLSTEKYDLALTEVSDPQRRAKLQSQSGDLDVRNVALKALELTSESGDISVSQASENLSIQTQSGDIHLSGSVYDGQVRSQSGSIVVEASIQHLLKIEGRSSDLAVQKLEGQGRLELQTQSGDIELTASLSGENTLNSASGDLQCDLTIPDQASASLNTHSGDLDLILRPQSQCRLDLEAPLGDIECRLELSDKDRTEHSLKGKVGDGEGLLRAKTHSGDILLS